MVAKSRTPRTKFSSLSTSGPAAGEALDGAAWSHKRDTKRDTTQHPAGFSWQRGAGRRHPPQDKGLPKTGWAPGWGGGVSTDPTGFCVCSRIKSSDPILQTGFPASSLPRPHLPKLARNVRLDGSPGGCKSGLSRDAAGLVLQGGLHSPVQFCLPPAVSRWQLPSSTATHPIPKGCAGWERR